MHALMLVLGLILIAMAVVSAFLWTRDRIVNWWFGRRTVDIEIPAHGVLSVPKELIDDGDTDAFIARIMELMSEPVPGPQDPGSR